MGTETHILARTIYGEARGEYNKINGGLSALIAVGNVVMNRLAQKTWYGATVQEVCQKPWQFSCWNRQDPNYALLQVASIKDPVYDVCLGVAGHVLCGKWPDIVKGCDHYHVYHMTNPPRWSKLFKPMIRIGDHLFYHSKEMSQ